MKKYLTLTVILICSILFGQNKPAYQLFDKKGKKVSYAKLLKAAEKTQVVLFGELHNDAIAHWLELELAQDIATKRKIVMGAEMFEADNQEPLNLFLERGFDLTHQDSVMRLWPNYKTDYRPLVHFARKNKSPFIATNVPRRFARLVYKKGFGALDSLSTAEKTWIAPLPIAFDADLPGYANMLKMMGDHGSVNIAKSQAIKDATMAYFIMKNLKDDTVFIHYNGSYHSDHFEGIYWYLKKSMPSLDIVTISSVEQTDLEKLDPENYTKADYILVIDEDVTKTY